MSGRQAWTAGRLDGYVAARFGSGAGSARIWVQDALAAGFTVAVYKGEYSRIDLFPYARGAVPHAAVPCSAGGLLTLVAVCYPDAASNVVPLPLAAGSGR